MTKETIYFNNDVKQKAIRAARERNEQCAVFLPRIFLLAKPYEEMYCKDIADFLWIELLNFLSAIKRTSFESLNNIVSQLKLYAEWSNPTLYNSFDSPYKNITNEMIHGCVYKNTEKDRIFTRLELKDIIDQLPNAGDKFIVLALWEGFYVPHEKDFINLRPENFSGNYVSLNSGRTLRISSELITYAQEAAIETEYVSLQSNGLKTYSYLERDTTIVKASFNSTDEKGNNMCRTIRNKLIRIETYLGESGVNMPSLRKSGMFAFINSLVTKDDKCFTDIIKRNRKEIEYRYGKIQSIPVFEMKYGRYFKAYKKENRVA